MRSSGGVAPAAEAPRARERGASSPGLPAGRSAQGCSPPSPATGTRSGSDMGGTSCDVCVVEGGARAQDRLARDRRARAVNCPMVDVHTVGAGGGSIAWRRRGRRPARGAALGRCRARARLLRPGAAPSRRSPTRTWSLGYLAPDSRLAGRPSSSTGDAARAAIARLGEELGIGEHRGRRGHRARRQQRDGPGAPRGDRRARSRPAAVRADAVRGAGPMHAARARRGARDDPDPPARGRAGCSRRSASPPPSAAATPPAP